MAYRQSAWKANPMLPISNGSGKTLVPVNGKPIPADVLTEHRHRSLQAGGDYHDLHSIYIYFQSH
jgi:hypothetical protein